MTYLTDICEGTNLGDLAFYLARKRDTNDLHGLGAFLIMNELFMRSKPTASQPRKVVKISVTNPTNEGRVEDVVLKIADLQRTAPDFNAQTATVTLDKDGATGDVEAPSQADDLNGDGKPDELASRLNCAQADAHGNNILWRRWTAHGLSETDQRKIRAAL